MSEPEELSELLYKCIENKEPLSRLLESTRISKLPFCSSSEVRLLTAEALAFDCSGSQSETVLLQLAKDRDPLVRVEAVDSLSGYVTPSSFEAFADALTDGDGLVRSYAAFGIGYVGKRLAPDRALSILLRLKEKETDPHVLSSCLEGLYLLGRKSELKSLIQLFQLDDYQLQCSILNELKELLCEENCEIILDFVSTTDLTGYPGAVKASMQELIGMCRETKGSDRL